MGDAEGQLRDRLDAVGLAHHADALLEVASPSIRLIPEGESSEQILVRRPASVWGLDGGVEAVAGSYHNLALRDDGTVVAWGENGAGQLGDGTRKHRRSPVSVRDLSDIAAISAGEEHSLALTSSGRVLAWGGNQWGELGDGTRTNRHTAVPVPGLDTGFVAMVAGDRQSLALRGDGAVVAWGLNSAGAIGIDNIPDGPVLVPGLERDIIAIAAGGNHCLALSADGAVLAWGMAGTPGLGGFGPADLSRPPYVSHPAPVEGLPAGIRTIAAAEGHSLAVTSQGAVLAWGEGFSGQLGDGARENRYPPVQVSGLSAGVRAIAAGYNCSYAIRDDGALLSWGWNYAGQLGDGGTADSPAPQPVPALDSGVSAVSWRLALMEDGSVREWGGEYPADELGADARLGLAATKLGGRPDLRARSRWPSREGRPLSFVAQINLAQVAALDSSGLLPRAGLLSFFYGDPAAPLEPDLCEVVFSEPGTPLGRRESPDELADHERYAAVALRPEAELSLPPAPPSFLSEEERDAYQWKLEELAPGPRHRLLGQPDLVQNDPRDGDALLLLQVDSDERARMMWGDVGRLYYFIRPDDLGTKRFEASRCELQSH